ncbi:MAG: magnesium transporter MgtE N-terminal domain-containing protein [Actinomycetota bacterium]
MTTGPGLDRTLSLTFIERHPADAARALDLLPAEEAAALVLEVAPVPASAAIGQMTPSCAADLLTTLGHGPATKILAQLDLDAAAAILRRMPPDAGEELLAAARPVDRQLLRRLISYPGNTAGALVDPLILALPDDITVGEALLRVRAAPENTIYYVYTIDRRRRLSGVVSLRDLMLADATDALRAVARDEVAQIPAAAELASIVAHAGWGEFHALPVVDHDGTYLGAIRYKTLRRLETEVQARAEHPTPVSVAMSLSELYWVGLSGLLEGMARTAVRAAPPQQEGGADAD